MLNVEYVRGLKIPATSLLELKTSLSTYKEENICLEQILESEAQNSYFQLFSVSSSG